MLQGKELSYISETIVVPTINLKIVETMKSVILEDAWFDLGLIYTFNTCNALSGNLPSRICELGSAKNKNKTHTHTNTHQLPHSNSGVYCLFDWSTPEVLLISIMDVRSGSSC